MSVLICVFEGLYVKTDSELYKKISSLLIKILTLIFTLGVATGIVLEFSFGTNWSNYSRMVGDIFGAPLAAEGIFSFFLESVFLGVLIFGRKKVSKAFYFTSTILVSFASHLSGLWIIIANSWMQTPAGYKMEGGRAVLTDFFAAALNPSTVERYTHTIVGCWITGSLFVAGIAAWYLLKNRDTEIAKSMLKISLVMFIFSSFLQFATGHAHAIQVAKTQPVKMAAFEALWETKKGAPMSLIGFPSEESESTHFEIAVPKLLSLLIDFDPNSEVKGIKDFPKDERPPIALTYFSYHIMIMLGGLFAFLAITGTFLMLRGSLFSATWYLKALFLSIPLPLIANEVGWMAAEVGRQPWAVWGVLKTQAAASPVVPAWQILFTIIMFTSIYIILTIFFMKILIKIIKKGPEEIAGGY